MSRLRLLAVEDSEEFQTLVRDALARRGWDVVGVPTMREAFETLAKPGVRFDALLVDLCLPDSTPQGTITLLPELKAQIAPGRLVVATGVWPTESVNGKGADVVLAKGSEGILWRLLEAITPQP